MNKCLGIYRGGTIYNIYVPFSYPTENVTVGTAYANLGSCTNLAIGMQLVYCPGGFYVYSPASHPYSTLGYITCKNICHLSLSFYVSVIFTAHIAFALTTVCICTCSDHSDCAADSCGPLAQCDSDGGCICLPGYKIPSGYVPTPDSYGCTGKDPYLFDHHNCYNCYLYVLHQRPVALMCGQT